MKNDKLLRGGPWDGAPWYCRSAVRYYYPPGSRDYVIGFRVVCEQGEKPTDKVVRGGSWDLSSRNCRSACRDFYYPISQGLNIGFRVVCEENQTNLKH